tara:strand:+ start:2992 stop:3693 length:702 start_codon:yes stop_codon:yes gene_type:complete
MKNYKIIEDEAMLKEFIEWLPELQDNEKFYVCLFARKKYCKELIKSNDKTQLKRFISNKARLYNKIEQLEIPMNTWHLRDTVAPQESLALYILPNPRNMIKATHAMGKKCWDLIYNKNYSLQAEAMSCIQRAKSRTSYVHFDIDTDEDVHEMIEGFMKVIFPLIGDMKPCWHILQTRGGYHLLIEPQRASMISQWKNWHGEVTKVLKDYIEQEGDLMMPVPGCVQGGFVPKFI